MDCGRPWGCRSAPQILTQLQLCVSDPGVGVHRCRVDSLWVRWQAWERTGPHSWLRALAWWMSTASSPELGRPQHPKAQAGAVSMETEGRRA